MPRTYLARLLIGGTTAVAVLMSGLTSSQAQTNPLSSAKAPPTSELIEVPVTEISPGGVDLAPEIKSPVADDPGAAARGMKYYADFNCIGCHADNGGGGMGPALSNRYFLYGGEPAQIYLSIAQGRPHGMPAWGTVLPSSVIWDMVAYVQSISQEPSSHWGNTTSLDALKIQQVPAEFLTTPDPWKYTEPFSYGKAPSGG